MLLPDDEFSILHGDDEDSLLSVVREYYVEHLRIATHQNGNDSCTPRKDGSPVRVKRFGALVRTELAKWSPTAKAGIINVE